MSRISLTDELRADYRRLFATCRIDPPQLVVLDALIDGCLADRARYETVAATLALPWCVVAILHYLETERVFDRHLHNGDPLAARTVHQPAERPAEGEPPFSWEDSAIDALRLRFLGQWQDWSIAGTLFQLEGYNTWAYRLHQPEVCSPYLWAGCNHYRQGRFFPEDIWSATAVAERLGGAVLLRRLAERELIELAPEPDAAAPQPIRYSAAPCDLPAVRQLQGFLNELPGIFLSVDGWPGPRTSAALYRVLGRYLPGDPVQ